MLPEIIIWPESQYGPQTVLFGLQMILNNLELFANIQKKRKKKSYFKNKRAGISPSQRPDGASQWLGFLVETWL